MYLYDCNVEGNRCQADGNEPACDWTVDQNAVHNFFADKKSNTMTVLIASSADVELIPLICC